jgi:hypothetical protein
MAVVEVAAKMNPVTMSTEIKLDALFSISFRKAPSSE